ncbi:carboxypeptidase-like regulatory domain-containing protein [Telluribacter sp. SYSU D00476]|uniref:carboxypeptidase-like regulatory domain-containing protein n=1 Tax=Telluribacter sp. SYSU D00476 TaxID=2811430 RepID=UPI001FF2B673|nr:carboxypeptidase-like regulatory domain-containing protein [Telluribacter sp. SYSU D00476]
MGSRWIFTWLCCLVVGTTLGQSVQGRVVNYITGSPVAYALVTNTTRTTGLYTDTSGLFRWSGTLEGLLVSAPGYQTLRIDNYNPDSVLKVSLVEKPLVLEQMPSTANKRPQMVQKGAWRKRPSGYFSSCQAEQPREVALYIPNEKNEEGVLRKVSFYVSSKGKQRAPVRVRVYKNAGGIPGDDLLDESVVLTPGRPWYRWKDVIIGRYNIPVPKEGLFVGLEWLHSADSTYESLNGTGTRCFGQILGVTDEFDRCRGWYRTNGGSWGQEPCKAGETSKTASPMIRVEWLSYR